MPDDSADTPPRPNPTPNPILGPDPVNIGCNILFGLLLLIPAAALIATLVVAVASVPLLVALFPTAITLGALAMLVLYIRHRRARRAVPPPDVPPPDAPPPDTLA